MALILQTSTELTIEGNDFTLISSYSGETNPNVKFIYTLTILDQNSAAIEGAVVEIGGIEYIADNNGQISVELIRGNYIANVSKDGYLPSSDSFVILDQNVSNGVQLNIIGSFDESFDESFE